MISTSTTTRMARNGSTSLVKSTIVVRLIPHTTNMTDPKGGVTRARLRLYDMTTPRWMGSIPARVAMGRIMGVMIRRIAIDSIRHPRMSSRTFSASRMTQTLAVALKNGRWPICSGTPPRARIHEKAEAVARMNMTLPVPSAARRTMAASSRSLIER